MRMKFNIDRLLRDLGGARRVAELTGTPRTAPYRWATVGYIASPVLEKIKAAHPELDLNSYFEPLH